LRKKGFKEVIKIIRNLNKEKHFDIILNLLLFFHKTHLGKQGIASKKNEAQNKKYFRLYYG